MLPAFTATEFVHGMANLARQLRGNSDLEVGMCGLTDRAEYAVDSIRFLKTLRQNPNGAIIFGTVKQYVKGSTFVSLNNKPISGASVLLQDPLHGDKKETAVDSTGWYEFGGLSEGVYTHSVQTPIGFTGVFQHTIEVRANGCAQVDVRGHSNNQQLAPQK